MHFEHDYRHRFVKFTEPAREDVKKLDKQFERFKEILVSIQIFLGGYAHCGKLVHSPIYLYQTQKQYNAPSFDWYYPFDEQEVRIHKIEVTEEEIEGAD